ncbi:MAG: MFS transporter [Planctomycetes bacterium]|nr:MFS transporter [Planctomycetota bacterium]
MKHNDLDQKRTQWEFITLGCMFVGYMGFILSRTALPVASPEMLKDPTLGLDAASYGDIAAWGMAGMISGKLLTGVIADWLGGRRVFLVALSITALLTFTFSWGTSAAVFASMNFLLLFAMAASWPSMASIISVWYPSTKYGRVWGIISVSSRLGASISMILLGTLLTVFSWQNLFRTAGVVGLCVVVSIFFYLKANPKDVGLPALEDQVAPEGSDRQAPHFLDDKNPAEALWAFASSGRFWLICLSLMCTTILMDFILFLPLYLTSFEGVSSAQAGSWAAAFPIGCLLALLVGGFIYDRVSRKGRVGLLGGLLGATCVCVAALWSLKGLPMIPDSFKFPLAIVILFFYGFTLAPAYYLPASIFSNEFGGKHCGLLVGLVDVAAYSASLLYLVAGGRMVVSWGWQSMIQLFLVIAVLATLITIWFAFEDYRRFVPTVGEDQSRSLVAT